jgi:hypothetical protein
MTVFRRAKYRRLIPANWVDADTGIGPPMLATGVETL